MEIQLDEQKSEISLSEKKVRLQFIHWLKPVVFFEIFYNNFQGVITWYKSEYIAQGWELYKSFNKTGKDWKIYCSVWTKGIMVQATVVAEGSILEKFTDYDIISGSALTNMISYNL